MNYAANTVCYSGVADFMGLNNRSLVKNSCDRSGTPRRLRRLSCLIASIDHYTRSRWLGRLREPVNRGSIVKVDDIP